MADNVAITAGSGTSIGTDDVSGVHFQKVKLVDGTADSSTPIPGGANGLQVVPMPHPNRWQSQHSETTAQTNHVIVAAPGAGSLYITDILISNGATAGEIKLLDGSGGTVLVHIYPAANGGAVLNLNTPIKLTATTALCLTSVTVTTHTVTVCGFTA